MDFIKYLIPIPEEFDYSDNSIKALKRRSSKNEGISDEEEM